MRNGWGTGALWFVDRGEVELPEGNDARGGARLRWSKGVATANDWGPTLVYRAGETDTLEQESSIKIWVGAAACADAAN